MNKNKKTLKTKKRLEREDKEFNQIMDKLTATPLDRSKWNPRYLSYCAAHGYKDDPEGMKEADRNEWGAVVMVNFMVWSNIQASKYRKELGLKKNAPIPDHDHYTRWLQERFE